MQEMFLPKVSISVCLYAGIFFTNESSAQSFLRTMGIPERQERGLVLHRSASGAIYLGGNVGDSALVQRIDVNGELIWSRTFKVEGQQPNMVYHFSDAPDGSIIGCGRPTVYSSSPRSINRCPSPPPVSAWTIPSASLQRVPPQNRPHTVRCPGANPLRMSSGTAGFDWKPGDLMARNSGR